MGEIAAKVINAIGLTALLFGFIANLDNKLSILLGLLSACWLVFRALKERENWLFRKAERLEKELDVLIKKNSVNPKK
jgi:hypothetical protein